MSQHHLSTLKIHNSHTKLREDIEFVQGLELQALICRSQHTMIIATNTLHGGRVRLWLMIQPTVLDVPIQVSGASVLNQHSYET